MSIDKSIVDAINSVKNYHGLPDFVIVDEVIKRFSNRAKRKANAEAHNAEFELRESGQDRPAWLANLKQPSPHKNGQR